eukprot:CAMPEP_0119145220 /NCGR_PEP_ID=MMETSP1310-20130426/37185_1 /TAXON_ID=464262 /ORGANISM="Genus nov. species nov., Strain RCC2339" /LENGTH=436 /DNA_ID=CAMNT_0007137019 /DNA_START=227 /DNA_END=1537 /DNA_ORIENTATION=+
MTAAGAGGASTATCEGYFSLVESIPLGIDLHWPGSDVPNKTNYFHSTSVAYLDLVRGAQSSIDIVCFYMTLRSTPDTESTGVAQDVLNGHVVGAEVFHELREAALRGVKVRIVISYPGVDDVVPDGDAAALANEGLAEVRVLNMTEVYGSGICHTKFMLCDGERYYVGSANMDWRSLTQVKELGVVVESPCLADDMARQFQSYWDLARLGAVPPVWPSSTWALYNATTPAVVGDGTYYTTASPGWFAPPGRSVDLDVVVSNILAAEEFVDISVMTYLPLNEFTTPQTYFPQIDTALRAAAFKGVRVRLLVSLWPHSPFPFFDYLTSLDVLNGLEVILIQLPRQEHAEYVPYTRVNHCKYMVTDKTALISTSNWSGDYFTTTLGASLVTDSPRMRQDVELVFERDTASQYAYPLSKFPPNSPPTLKPAGLEHHLIPF